MLDRRRHGAEHDLYLPADQISQRGALWRSFSSTASGRLRNLWQTPAMMFESGPRDFKKGRSESATPVWVSNHPGELRANGCAMPINAAGRDKTAETNVRFSVAHGGRADLTLMRQQ